MIWRLKNFQAPYFYTFDWINMDSESRLPAVKREVLEL